MELLSHTPHPAPAVWGVTLHNHCRESRLLWRPTRWRSRGLVPLGFVVHINQPEQASVNEWPWIFHGLVCSVVVNYVTGVYLSLFGPFHVSVWWLRFMNELSVSASRSIKRERRWTHTDTHTRCTRGKNLYIGAWLLNQFNSILQVCFCEALTTGRIYPHAHSHRISDYFNQCWIYFNSTATSGLSSLSC